MAGNITDDWPDFVSTSISYFIWVLLYSILGADVIVLAKIFPSTYIANNCGKNNLTYMDYIFPTDPDKPPYGGTSNCPKPNTRKTQADLMTCNYTDTRDSTNTGNILGRKGHPGMIWDFLEKIGMSDVGWPYINLRKTLDKHGKEPGAVGYWFNYTIANIVYKGFDWSRSTFKYLTAFLDIIPDPILILLGPIFIGLIIFISNSASIFGSYWGAFSPLFGVGIGELPSAGVAWGFIVGGLILFSIMVILQGLHPEWFTTWWGTLINVIVMLIVMSLGGFVFVLPAINTFIVVLYSILTMFYPLMANNGKFLLNVLFCNKDFIAMIYAFIVCAIAFAYLNNTLAYTMWFVFAIMVAIKIFQSF